MARERRTAARTAMKAGGYYSARTRGAKYAIERALPDLLAAAAEVPAPPAGRPFQIADFGAADGGTSKRAIAETVRALRARDPERQIVVTYTDLPSNDYAELFKNQQGLTGDMEDCWFLEVPGVFMNAVGVGFHRQLLPDGVLQFGHSATAMHYVSAKPCEIEAHVHMVGASQEERARFAAQAREDWEAILIARAAELSPGGRFVCLNFCIDEAGGYLGATGGVVMFDMFERLWREMRDRGSITDDEYVAATFAQHYRTLEEFTAPFAADGPASRAGLRLLAAETRRLACPYRAAFEEAAGAMSAREFAASYVPTLRSWSETVFRNALSDARPAEERAALVDEFYGAYEDAVAADPTGHAMDYVHCYMVIEKAR